MREGAATQLEHDFGEYSRPKRCQYDSSSSTSSIFNLFSTFFSSRRQPTKPQTPVLPLNNLQASATSSSLSGGTTASNGNRAQTTTERLFLLLCVNFNRDATKLIQPKVCHVASDQALFELIDRQYTDVVGRLKRCLSVKRVSIIRFVEVRKRLHLVFFYLIKISFLANDSLK